MNKVVLIGRLTRDVELKEGQSGKKYANVSIAINRSTDGTDYPLVKVFGSQAENLAKYSGKGEMVAVEGHIQTSSFNKDGETKYVTDIICDRVEFLSWKKKESEGQ